MRIIFESFNPDLNIKAMTEACGRDVRVKQLVRRLSWKENASGLARAFCFKPIVTGLTQLEFGVTGNDLVLELD